MLFLRKEVTYFFSEKPPPPNISETVGLETLNLARRRTAVSSKEKMQKKVKSIPVEGRHFIRSYNSIE